MFFVQKTVVEIHFLHTGQAKRSCDEHSHWLQPDFSGCISQDYSKMQSKVSYFGLIYLFSYVVGRIVKFYIILLNVLGERLRLYK